MNRLRRAIVQNELNLKTMKSHYLTRGTTKEELQTIADDLEALLNQLQRLEKL